MQENFHISQDAIKIFADVGGDPNPIHQDIVAAQKMGLEGPIAHGMFVYCYLMGRLDTWIKEVQSTSGVKWTAQSTRCRFYDLVMIGKTFTSTVELMEEKEDGTAKVGLTLLSEEGKRLTHIVAQLKK